MDSSLRAAGPVNQSIELSSRFAARLEARLRDVLPECDEAERRRRVAGTLDFLHCCAQPDAPPLAPSPAIDAVWHEMIMFTSDYRKLCHSMGVAFIDHEPLDDGDDGTPTVAETISFMEKREFHPPADLWETTGAAKCCSGHVSF